jgi:nucleoside-diphosphate-sugar epimerase
MKFWLMSSSSLHTVLGASGAMGYAVLQALQDRQLPLRGVGRKRRRDDIDWHTADLLKLEETQQAIEGASHVYLCAGLPYRTDVWLRDWPLLMQHVIEACLTHDAVLIFLDNVYMYGPAPLEVPFDEHHTQQPVTQKGWARYQTANILLEAVEEQGLKAVIGRSADFYGPFAANSPFYISFLERMLQGKAPQSIATKGIPHTYAYTLDSGRALVELALDPSTYGQVWHLPVGPAVTMDEVVQYFNTSLGTHFQVSYLPPFMRKVLSLFIGPLKEAGQMLYQYDTEYVMSFEKFKTHFPDFKATSYEEGVTAMVASFQEKGAIKSNL